MLLRRIHLLAAEILLSLVLSGFAPLARGQTFQTLGSLSRSVGYPSGLVQGSDGNFYGTTYGSTTYGGYGGLGTVFEMTPNGALIMVVLFNGSTGFHPQAGLVQGTDGNFYGTTTDGLYDRATVFKVTTNGVLTTLVWFNQSIPYWQAELVQGSDGN